MREEFVIFFYIFPVTLIMENVHVMKSTCYTKDHREKIDFQFQEVIFAVVNWPNSELYNMLHWLVCYKPAGQSFPNFWVWVSADFDSKYKILWGETRDHWVPIH